MEYDKVDLPRSCSIVDQLDAEILFFAFDDKFPDRVRLSLGGEASSAYHGDYYDAHCLRDILASLTAIAAKLGAVSVEEWEDGHVPALVRLSPLAKKYDGAPGKHEGCVISVRSGAISWPPDIRGRIAAAD